MCLRPLYLKKYLPDNRVVERCVPCGVCPECLKKRQSAIVVRAVVEASKRPRICFFTLTYNDDKCPASDESGELTLRREDLKNWKKEFRKLISSKDFSWLCCGEYGPRTKRPHYHGLFFGLSESDLALIQHCWESKYGFAVFKNIAASSQKDVTNVCRYVSKYVVKDEEFKTPSDFVEKPRLMTSVGFGLPDERFFDWLLCKDKYPNLNPFDSSTFRLDAVMDIIDRMYFRFGDYKYSIPQYAIRKKLYSPNLKGNLSPSPLLKMVSRIKEFRNRSVSDKEFRQMVSDNSERTIEEVVSAFNDYQKVLNSEKFSSERENIVSTYKKSKF